MFNIPGKCRVPFTGLKFRHARPSIVRQKLHFCHVSVHGMQLGRVESAECAVDIVFAVMMGIVGFLAVFSVRILVIFDRYCCY